MGRPRGGAKFFHRFQHREKHLRREKRERRVFGKGGGEKENQRSRRRLRLMRRNTKNTSMKRNHEKDILVKQPAGCYEGGITEEKW